VPLITQVIRGGEPLGMKRGWGGFHIAALALAASFDSGQGPFADPAGIYKQDLPGLAYYPDAPFPVNRQVVFYLADYGALGLTPLNGGSYTLTRKQAFMDLADGEVLRLEPGDVLIAQRQ